MGLLADISLAVIAALWVGNTIRSVFVNRRAARAERRARRYQTRRALALHFRGTSLQSLVCIRRSFPLQFRADLQKAFDGVFGGRSSVRAFYGVKSNRMDSASFAALLDGGDLLAKLFNQFRHVRAQCLGRHDLAAAVGFFPLRQEPVDDDVVRGTD